MKKLILFAAIAASFAGVVGCKSIEVEYRGKDVATYTDTNNVVRVVCDDAGKPVLIDKGWCVDYFQHGLLTKFDRMQAEAGPGAKLELNGYESGVDTNFVALVSASFDGGARLATAIGDAYVKIAGGGAQASTVLGVTKKIVQSFKNGGGDVSKAQLTTDTAANTISISDGSTCTTCDAAGNCTTGSCSL